MNDILRFIGEISFASLAGLVYEEEEESLNDIQRFVGEISFARLAGIVYEEDVVEKTDVEDCSDDLGSEAYQFDGLPPAADQPRTLHDTLEAEFTKR